MSYYVRVLSTSSQCVPLSALQSALEKEKLDASISADDTAPDDWSQLVLSHGDGTEIAVIERNLVHEGSLGAEELAEFAEEVAECEPASAATWLTDYFSRVRCIYAFQVLHGTEHQSGWEILDTIKGCLWMSAPGILQADFEGFTNEDGYHILWQFDESVEGDYAMGVLQDGQWAQFEMDLGNRKHRQAFLQGQIPEGVTLA